MPKSKGQMPLRLWRNRIVGQGDVPPHTLEPSPWNWRTHPASQKDAMAGVLSELGWIQQIVVNKSSGRLIDGHLRLALAIEQQAPTVPVLYVELSEAEEKLALATLDPLSALAEADREQLAALLQQVQSGDAAVQAMLAGLAEQEGIMAGANGDASEDGTSDGLTHGSLADRFGVPPFTVLDARQGYWQDRKRAWLALGIQSELGRGESLGAIPPNEAALRERRFGDNGLLGESQQARSHYKGGGSAKRQPTPRDAAS